MGLVLTAAACLSVACGSWTTASSTTTTVSIPVGWKTYTLGRMALSVPRTWIVKHDTDCPDTTAPGTLLLGVPPVLVQCADFAYPATVVTVSQLGSATSTTARPVGQTPVTVNGIPVYPEFGSPDSLHWSVPSLDVQIIGTGPDSGRVLHTLHRA